MKERELRNDRRDSVAEVNTEVAEGKAIQYQLVNSEKSAEERRKRSHFEKKVAKKRTQAKIQRKETAE